MLSGIKDKFTSRRRDLPSLVAIEVSNLCNCTCIICPLFQGPDQMDRNLRPPMTMSLDLFKNIISQIAEWEQPPDIFLNMFGEPLTDKGLPEKMAFLRETGLSRRAVLQTNGQLLTREISHMLLSNGLGQLVPCMDSINPEVFEKIRPGAKSAVVLQNILDFTSLRDELNPATRISIQHVRTEYNLDDHADVYAMFKPYLTGKNDALFITSSMAWASPSLLSAGGILCKFEDQQLSDTCSMLHSHLIILSDGLVSSCCYDFNLEHGAMGDAKKQTLIDIWNDRKYSDLIRNLEYKKKCSKRCSQCSVLFSDFSKYNDNLFGYDRNSVEPGHHGVLVRFSPPDA